jgi:Na+-transporting methylmalonyl-CoA/oxaloacetate decarboxylase gamma subunit
MEKILLSQVVLGMGIVFALLTIRQVRIVLYRTKHH